MQELSDQGYRSIYLTDDHFLLKRKRIADICNGIIDRKLKFHWGCEGRVDSMGIEALPLMGKAHCDMLAYGIESGTQKMLDRLGKRQKLEQIELAVGEAKRHGIARVHGFFVIGWPGETAEDIRETFRFAARLPTRHLRLQPAGRLPGNAALERVRQPRDRRRRPGLGQDLQVLRHRPGHGPQRRGQRAADEGLRVAAPDPHRAEPGEDLGAPPHLQPAHAGPRPLPAHQRPVPQEGRARARPAGADGGRRDQGPGPAGELSPPAAPPTRPGPRSRPRRARCR